MAIQPDTVDDDSIYDRAVAASLGLARPQTGSAPLQTAGAVAPTDAYDSAVAASLGQDREHRASNARLGYFGAVGTNPDAYAQALRTARETGVPVGVVLAEPQEMKRQQAMGSIDFDDMAQHAPATAAALADPEKAKLAHDNVDSMQAIERTFIGGITEPFMRGWAQTKRGLTMALESAGIFSGWRAQREQAMAAHGLEFDPLTDTAARLVDQGRVVGRYPLPEHIEKGMADISGVDNFTDAAAAIRTNPAAVLETIIQSLGAAAPGLLAAAAGSAVGPAGTALGSGAGSFAVEYGNTLQEALDERGVNTSDPLAIRNALADPEFMNAARTKAAKRGIAVGAFDALTAGLAGRLLAGAKPTALSVGGRALGEMGLQAAGGGAGEATAQAVTGEFRPGDILMEMVAEIPTGAVEVPGNYRHAMQRAAQAEQGAKLLENINQLAAADKLLARDPATFEQFIEQAAEGGNVQHVFIDANTLQQSGLGEALAEISPAVAQQLPQALATGGQVAIPVAEYTARVAPTEHAAGLLDHLKIDPEGFSRAEAQQFMENQSAELLAEVEKSITAQQAGSEVNDSALAVRAKVKGDLDAAARFSPQVNDAYSTMVGNFYAVQAAKLGMTPEQLFERYPLKVQAESIAGEHLNQYGFLDGQPYEPPEVKLTAEEKAIVLERYAANGGVDAIGVGSVEDSTDIAAKSAALQALAEREGYTVAHSDAIGKYMRLEKGDVSIPVRVSDHSNVNRGAHFKESAINLAPDDGYAFDTFASVLWKLRNATVDEYGDLFFGEEEAQYFQSGANQATHANPVASISGEEIAPLGTDIKTLRDATRAWYDATLRNTSVTNRSSGREVLFTKAAKAFSTSAKAEKLQLFAALKDIIEKGDILASRPPVDPQVETNTKAYHWLVATVELDGKLVKVGVTLREDNRGHLYYNHNPVEVKASPAPELGDTAHEAGAGTNKGEAFEQSVIQNDDGINIDVLAQANKPSSPRGSFSPDSLTISLLKNADLSTFLHESGHFFLEVQLDMAARVQQEASAFGEGTNSPQDVQLLKDTNALLDWFGIASLSDWYSMDLEQKRAHHEKFARGFEAYLFEGKSPSVELHGLFQRFRAWLVRVYSDLKNLDVQLNDEVRGVFDRMLATDEEIANAQAGRSMMPLFESAEVAGMTEQEFAAYQALGADATANAVEELQAKGLRDMQWLRNARGREIGRLKKLAKGLRAEVEIEARKEVMSQPIYQAWDFLTRRLQPQDQLPEKPRRYATEGVDPSADTLFAAIAKLGGLNRTEAQSQWGVDPKARIPMPAFGKHVLRRDGGLSFDAMAEQLAEHGYLKRDEHGRHDLRELEERFLEELHGEPQRSMFYDYSADVETRAGDQVARPDALGAGRLDLGELRSMDLPAEIIQSTKARRMTAANGLHPDIVAEMFGFTSGDELVRTLAVTDPPREAISALADVRMLEEHGELASPEAIERAADQAIHNDARARFVATETNALARATGQRKVLTSAAREFAANLIARLRVRDIRPGQYANAEVRAARAAEKASRAGDLATAAAEKRNQLVQNYATRAAYDAQDEVSAGLHYLRKFNGDIKTLDADYAEQIASLLERFDLRSGQSLKAVDKRAALADWINRQREAGFEPDIPPQLLNEAFRQSYKDMTVEEFRGLVDSVRQIEHLGRLKHKLLTAKDQRNYAEVRDEIAQGILTHAGNRQGDTRTPTTNLGRAAQGLKRFWASHIKAATWARVMDGGKDGGPMWEYLIRTANERGDMETTMRAHATSELTRIMAPIFQEGRMGGKGTFFPTIGRSLNREARIAIALNLGNTGNTQRLLGGEGWTMGQISTVLQTLTAAEWNAVQAVWDHFEQYRPEIGAKERRVYGKEPAWVEPQSFSVTTADGQTLTLRGGYYPIKYDPAASQRAEEHADAEGAKRQLQGAYTSSTTRRSFTKTRTEEVKGRPLLYTLSGLYSGVNDVIHDLAWHEWLIDSNRLLRSHTIDTAIREHYGPEAKQQLKSWAADIAEGDAGTTAALDMALARLRQGVSVSGLGFNVMSALIQPLGLTQSVVRVGARWMGRGIARYIAHPVGSTREANARSEFMANRARTRFRELNELRNKVQDQGAAREWIGRYAYFLMMRCQQLADVPTWWGAYEKAIAAGNDEERAVSLADQAVIDAQGGGQTKDLAAIERGGPALKLFTVFYSFMNTALNVGVQKTMNADTPARRAQLAVDYAMLYVAPVILGSVLKDAVTPGGGEDDDDLGEVARKLAGEQLDFLMGLMVVLREFSGAARMVTGTNEWARDYGGPAGLRLVGDTGKLATQVHQGEFDDAFRKAAVNTAGSLFGLPAAQINRTITGINALEEGETDNPAAVVFGFQRQR